jgi:hypothetical protein
MVVLGEHEWLASAVAEHERVEGGEQQTGRYVIGGQRVNVARRSGGFERPASLCDGQRGPLREVGCVAGAVACPVAGAKDRECLVEVDRRGRIGGVQQAGSVGDDEPLRRKPRNESVDRTLLERGVAALD